MDAVERALVRAPVEIFNLVSLSSRVCTESDKSLPMSSIKRFSMTDYVAGKTYEELDKMYGEIRQGLIYHEDVDFLDLARKAQNPQEENSFKSAVKYICKEFDDRGISCDYIIMSRNLVASLVDDLDLIEPITNREAVQQGYIGVVKDRPESTTLVTPYVLSTYEPTELNEMIGVHSLKCKRKVTNLLSIRSTKNPGEIEFYRSIQMVVDPAAIVRVNLVDRGGARLFPKELFPKTLKGLVENYPELATKMIRSLRSALSGCLQTMKMVEKRETGEFHLAQPSAKALWDQTKEGAINALCGQTDVE